MATLPVPSTKDHINKKDLIMDGTQQEAYGIKKSRLTIIKAKGKRKGNKAEELRQVHEQEVEDTGAEHARLAGSNSLKAEKTQEDSPSSVKGNREGIMLNVRSCLAETVPF